MSGRSGMAGWVSPSSVIEHQQPVDPLRLRPKCPAAGGIGRRLNKKPVICNYKKNVAKLWSEYGLFVEGMEWAGAEKSTNQIRNTKPGIRKSRWLV
jgi:hypothetical protein